MRHSGLGGGSVHVAKEILNLRSSPEERMSNPLRISDTHVRVTHLTGDAGRPLSASPPPFTRARRPPNRARPASKHAVKPSEIGTASLELQKSVRTRRWVARPSTNRLITDFGKANSARATGARLSAAAAGPCTDVRFLTQDSFHGFRCDARLAQTAISPTYK